MQIKDKIKPVLPHLIAVLIFTVVSFIYFYPVLEGKVLKANDSTVSKINSKEIQDFREKNGREPLWTNSIFSGMPAYLISTRYSGNLIKYADAFLRIFKMPVSVLFISMLGFYILLLIFGVDPWLAIAGAMAYGLSSFFFQIQIRTSAIRSILKIITISANGKTPRLIPFRLKKFGNGFNFTTPGAFLLFQVRR